MGFEIDRFSWRTYDVDSLLPVGWREQILVLVRHHAHEVTLLPRSVTSREGNPNIELPVRGVKGEVLVKHLPWLYELYKGVFRDLAENGGGEPIMVASDIEHAIVLNVQCDSAMRYEAHVDSNPIEGLLFATDLPLGSGGELVVANQASANTVDEIEADRTVIHPVAGHLLFFDGRRWPHYVRPLVQPGSMRVVAAMNYYTSSCQESERPRDLTAHLRGYDEGAIVEARRSIARTTRV